LIASPADESSLENLAAALKQLLAKERAREVGALKQEHEGGLWGYHRAQMRTATTAIAKARDSQLAEYTRRSAIGCPFAAVTFVARGSQPVLAAI